MKIEDKLEIKELRPSKFTKTVKIQYDGRQFSIRIPAIIVRILDIEKGHKFVFEVDLDKENKNEKVRFRLGDW